MAIDELLLQQAQLPTLRVYRWMRASLSFGYFGEIAAVEEIGAGRDLVRRWTGGGIVEHGEDLTYTLVVPLDHPLSRIAAPESYRMIHEVIGAMLVAEGASVEAAAKMDSATTSGECFVNPVQYDLLASGRKVAGAAQRRTRWGLLHQGSVQFAVQDAAVKLSGRLGARVSLCPLTAELEARARSLADTKYATSAWLRKF